MRNPCSSPSARCTPIGRPAVRTASERSPVRGLECLVAVTRSGSQLPSLAAARATASLRALGHAVRVVESDDAGLLRLPVLRGGADVLVTVDADDSIQVATSAGTIAGLWQSDLLVPDFTDLAFARTRVLPISAASASGRVRPLAAVLHEVREYARRHALPDLVFVDHVLNGMLDGLIGSIQRHAHGIQWMAAVRVGADESDGLSRKLLRSAASAGLRSLVLRAFDGRQAERAAELSAHASAAGIATRVVLPEPLVEMRRPAERFAGDSMSGPRFVARPAATIALNP